MTQKRILDRTVSMNFDDRPPFNDSPKAKTVTPSLFSRWKSFRNSTRVERGENITRLAYGDSPPLVEDMLLVDPSEENLYHDELSIKICKDTIRRNLLDNMKNVRDIKILLDIEGGHIAANDLESLLKGSSRIEINITFLWISFLKKYELFEVMEKLEIDINFTLSGEGLTALHLSAFSGCIKCCSWIIEKGCDVNQMSESYSPLHCAVLGNSTETTKLLLKHGAHLSNTVVHSAVLANALDCLHFLLSQGVDVNTVDASGMCPLHFAADRRMVQCMKVLLENDTINVDLKTRDMRNTALHYASDGGYVDCVVMLLDKKATVSTKNKKGQIPLHLAAKCQSIECVEVLLKAGSDVNAKDKDSRTPLHAAVSKSVLAFDTLEMLITCGADVTIQDHYGYTALHIATLNELSQCVDALIMKGADVSVKTKGGLTPLSIMCRKTPASLTTIRKKLDSSIALHDPEASNQEVELKLDFRYLLQHSYGGEVGLLKTLIDEGQKDLLEHPLCSAFLYIKWQKIRRYYFCRLLLSFIFVVFLTLYVMTALAHDCYNAAKNRTENVTGMAQCKNDTNNRTENVTGMAQCKNDSKWCEYLMGNEVVIDITWYILAVLAVCEAIRKLTGLAGYVSFKQYFMQWGNMFEWFTIISVFVISFIYKEQTYLWQNHVGAFAVLCGWTNLMVMIGQLPLFGTYVAMFTKVQAEFFKLLLAYACLLIGFTICFCVIFPTNKYFKNPVTAFVEVLIMMTGEVSLDPIIESSDPKEQIFTFFNMHVVFVLFLLFVTVVLMNLLVGIAVHDIQGLHKTAGLSKLVRQTELISFLEIALFQSFVPLKVKQFLKWTALVSPSFYRVVLHVKPLNPMENRLPKQVLLAAHDIARQRRKYKLNPITSTTAHKYSDENNTVADEVRQLKQLLLQQQETLNNLAAMITNNRSGVD